MILLAFDDGTGDVSAIDVSELHTLFEGWAQEVGGTYVASILGDTNVFLVGIEEVRPAPSQDNTLAFFGPFTRIPSQIKRPEKHVWSSAKGCL